MSTHQNTINTLVNRLIESGKYVKVTQNFNYRRREKGGWMYGEIDVLAVSVVRGKKYAHIFEIKSKDNDRNYVKARSQLDRAYKLFNHYAYRVFKFYQLPRRIEWIR